uniref:Protein phosphatase 1 regulatory subunit n=1 Tax=Xenopus tropicalis TaxID=8364 RepID=A0A803JZ81_XENTR
MKMADAKQKRNEQLKRWIGSETDLEPHVIKRKKTKVKFDDGAVFLAACSSGDTDEVLKLLDRGADINYANVDGLTALHQACIDDNIDMVKFLVEHGAGINQPDNEGWIPLHAASSCGYLDIAEYLISKGASVGVVNSEGDTPLDIAEEEAMEDLLQNEVNRQGIDVEAARKEEERIMLRDARQWLNSGQINDIRHSKSGGTALHVAAAKGYTEVLKLLLQAGYDVNVKDFDGWTPLHAAAHWGKEEACKILVENFCNVEAVNKVGQTALDVADEDILSYLEELQKKQNLLLSEKQEKKSPLIESSTTENNQSLKTLKNKETLIIEQEKTVSAIDSLEEEKADEEDEGKKDESSCSSEEEEEEDSESEAETDKTKSLSSVNSINSNSIPQASVTAVSSTVHSGQVTPTSPVKKYEFIAPFMPVVETMHPTSWRQGLRKTGIVLVPSKGDKSLFPTPPGKTSPKEEDRKDESPASWRLGLRKTGSYGALSEITASKEAQKERDFTGVMRSASSPRLSSTLDNKEKEKDGRGARLAYVAPTIPRRLASTSDIEEKENRDSSLGFLRGSSSYTRRKWDEDFKKNTSVNELLNTSYQRSSSFGRRQDDLVSSIPPGSTATVTSSGLARSYSSTINSGRSTVSSSSGLPSSTSNRFWADDSSEKDKDTVSTAVTIPVAPTILNTTSTSTTMTTTSTGTVPSSAEVRERRRSYLTPVRDEESESQRKARSRQARQSRRSTQGVTLTDLQEAEKTIGRNRPTTREQENEEKEKQDKEKQEDKKEFENRNDDFRQRYARSTEETIQRYRPSFTTPSTISLSSSSSSIYTSSQLNRPNSLTGISSSYSNLSRLSSKDPLKDKLDGEKKEEDKESEDKSQPKSIRERRRPREKRRSTGVSYWTQDSDENEQDHQSDTDEGTNKKENQTDSFSRYTTGLSSAISTDRYDPVIGQSGISSYLESRRLLSRLDREDSTDYKKRQERFADRSLLEIEKRERRALERRISEMEEELKMLPDLKADNQRLKDENGALIRVISKLSK